MQRKLVYQYVYMGKQYKVFIICDVVLTWIWGSIFLTSSIYKTIETRLGLEKFEIDSCLNWPLSG